MKPVRLALKALLGVLILIAHGVAPASPLYRFTHGLGDTATAVDINDSGTIVYIGFGDIVPGEASAVDGLCCVAGFNGAAAGVTVREINNAGDLLGQAPKDGKMVETLWINGVPHELSDPANSGLSFVRDPGPTSIAFDLSAIDVVDLPVGFQLGLFSAPPQDALTNARGDLVFFYVGAAPGLAYGVLSLLVAEPPVLPLTLGAMAFAIWISPRKRLAMPLTRTA